MLQKTGAVGENRDEEFDVLVGAFERTNAATVRMYEDLRKYRDTIANMLQHQIGVIEAFSETLDQTDGSPSALAHRELLASLLAKLQESKVQILAELQAVFGGRTLKILDELVSLQREIAAKITKRNHKLLDFDRHQHSMKKLESEKSTASVSNQQKTFKTGQQLSEAEQKYLQYNEQLKADLPVFAAIHSRLMEPLLEQVIRFQQELYRSQKEALARVSLLEGLDYATILHDHEAQIKPALLAQAELPIMKIIDLSVVVAEPTDAHPKSPESPKEIPAREIQSQPETKIRTLHAPKPSEERKTEPTSSGTDGMASPAQRFYQKQQQEKQTSSSHTLGGTEPPNPGRVAQLAARLGSMSVAQPSSGAVARSPPPAPDTSSTLPRLPQRKAYVVAEYDYCGEDAEELSFKAGDRIEIVKKSETANDWWMGRLNGAVGMFPGNYVVDE